MKIVDLIKGKYAHGTYGFGICWHNYVKVKVSENDKEEEIFSWVENCEEASKEYEKEIELLEKKEEEAKEILNKYEEEAINEWKKLGYILIYEEDGGIIAVKLCEKHKKLFNDNDNEYAYHELNEKQEELYYCEECKIFTVKEFGQFKSTHHTYETETIYFPDGD